MILSDQQRRAVERTGQDVCVVAGPGSGKTRVLIERFAWLVEQGGVDPQRILAITFTDKAATEIKERLIKRFHDQKELLDAVERAWVSTIDGFCTRILREYSIAAGLSPDFTVLDEPSAVRMRRECAESALDTLFRERPHDMRELLEALDLSTQDDANKQDLAATLIDVYEAMRLSAVTEIAPPNDSLDAFPEVRKVAAIFTTGPMPKGEQGPRLRDWASKFVALPDGSVTQEHLRVLADFEFNLNKVGKHPAAKRLKGELLPPLESQWIGQWYANLHDLLRHAISRLDKVYRARKREDAVVDFADLEEHAVRLLESDPVVRRDVAGRFDHVLMDEMQDTNPLQWRLIDLLLTNDDRSNFFAVGDINQSIYGFRHADPQVFTRYREDLRSSGAAIDQLDENYRSRQEILSIVNTVLDSQPGIESRPLTGRRDFASASEVVQKIVGQGDDSPEVEAALVASRIRGLVEGGWFRFADIAVLVRTVASAELFEQAFDRFGIPFLMTGGRGLLDTREARDIVAFLAALVNPFDEIALVGVLRSPLMGLSDEEIFRIGREGWREIFQARFGRVRELVGFLAPDRLVAQTLDETGYVASLTERSRTNIDKLLSWLRREFRNRPRPLAELLADLESLRDMRTESEAPPPDAGDVVRMMTIHAAKGLEFPVVFLAALHRRTDPQQPVIVFSRELGLGVKWRHPLTGKGSPDSIRKQLTDAIKEREQEEENRLLYVGMTRAENRLFLSYAERKMRSPWQKMIDTVALPTASADTAPEPHAPALREGAAVSQAILLDAPQVSGQYDGAASVTSVAMFHDCPRRYYLERFLGLDPRSEIPGTGAINLGLAVHRALAGEVVDDSEAQVLAERFQQSDLGRVAATATRIEREFDFLFEIDDIVLRGQIDLWFEDASAVTIVDYKTGRDESSTEEYTLQLRLYALALERYTGRPADRAILYYLRSNRQVEISVAPEDLASARAVVRQFREAQQELKFPMNVGERCGGCLFEGGVCLGRGIKPEVVSLLPFSSQEPAKDAF